MGDGTFRPNDTLTRAQFASVLFNYLIFKWFLKKIQEITDYLPMSVLLHGLERQLQDVYNGVMNLRTGSFAAKNIINRMVSLEMIHGKGNNQLELQAYITRGEVSTVLSQSVQYLTEASIKKETFENAVILNASSKRGDLIVSDVKVNGNLFINGGDIMLLI